MYIFVDMNDLIIQCSIFFRTQSTCDSIPGCDWSDLNQCSSDVIYPERYTIYFLNDIVFFKSMHIYSYLFS
jgi:hypothetical protein